MTLNTLLSQKKPSSAASRRIRTGGLRAVPEQYRKELEEHGRSHSTAREDLLDLTLLKNKSVTFVWELMFTRPMFQTADMIEQHKLLNKVARLVDEGVIRTDHNE